VTLDVGGNRQWRLSSTTAMPRYDSSAVVVGSDVWLIGGVSCNRSVTAGPGDPGESYVRSVFAFYNRALNSSALVP
jgi:hypothetical protein